MSVQKKGSMPQPKEKEPIQAPASAEKNPRSQHEPIAHTGHRQDPPG